MMHDNSELSILKDEKMYLLREKCLVSTRAIGTTTRLIDYYIQELYSKHASRCLDRNTGEKLWIEIKDHHDSRKSTMLLVDAILKRMGIEHPGDSVEHKFINGKCMMRLKCCRSEEYKKQAIEEINKRLEEINKLILDLS